MKKVSVTIKSFLLLIVFIAFHKLAFTQTPKWTHYTVASTSTQLCNNDVNAIAIDAQGNKWFGTRDGVSKFDGINWITYNTDNGLIDNFVYSIAIDTHGNKWFGTNGGVSKFDGTTWTNYSMLGSFKGYNVLSIAIDEHGNKWFASLYGVAKFNDTIWTNYTLVNGILLQSVTSIAIDAQGNKWFGTSYGGIVKFNNITWTNYTTSNGLVNNNVTEIAIDSQGNKWFGTTNGVSKFTGSTWTTYKTVDGLVSNSIYSIVIDGQGNKWFGTNDGVSKFDGSTWITYKTTDGLVSNSINSINIDNKGNKWFGTIKGVSKFDGSAWTAYSVDGLINNSVRSILLDVNDNMWIATEDGVSRYNGNTWTNFNIGFSEGIVNDLAGNIWVNEFSTLKKFDGDKWYLYEPRWQDSIYGRSALTIDDEGNKWFATFYGKLVKFDGVNWLQYSNQKEFWDSVSICVDRKQNIWAGTYGEGIYKIKNGIWTHYTTSDGLINNRIISLKADADDKIWIGTIDGVSTFDGTNWTNYTSANGLGGDIVTAIAIDAAGNKWFSTNGGITKFDGTNWTTYPVPLGVSNFRSIAIDKKGNKWLAGYGVYKFEDGGAGPLITLRTQVGAIFNDLDKDGVRDSGEPMITNQVITIDSNYYTTTTNTGYFHTPFGNGKHTISYKVKDHEHSTTNTKFTVTVNDNSVLDTILIGIAYDNDAFASLTGDRARAGFTTRYWINYGCYNNAQSGRVIFKPDPKIQVLATYPTADTITAGKIVWNFTQLKSPLFNCVYFDAKMPGISSLGDTIVSSANIIINSPDINLANNTSILKQRVVGSYDPNDKLVTPEGTGANKATPLNTPLTYTIRFQNTGTDTAFNVNIRDTLNANFDLSTLTVVSSSHPVTLELRSQNEAIFHFTNILLPDSNVNELGSNGFVKYSISPKANLPQNTVVTNKSYIYFDFNPPVATNEVKNTYVTLVGPASVMSMTTFKHVGSSFSFSLMANAANTPVQVDFGDGTLVSKTVGTSETTINGTLAGSQTVKIHGSGITYLSCYNNQLTTLDVSDNSSLSELICSYNQLSTLDLTKNTALTYLHCGKNNLDTLDLSKNTALTTVKCYFNQFASMDVSQNVALKTFDCSSNLLTSLDVTKNTGLSTLYCSYNQLSSLDVTGNLKLTTLSCNNNRITILDLSKNDLLSFLDCKFNLLSAIDVTSNPDLSMFYCNNNQFVFNTLPAKQLIWSTYSYAPQSEVQIAKDFEVGGMVDLSAHFLVKLDTTVYKWKTKGGLALVADNDYTIMDGVTTFLEGNKDSIYCEMTNKAFPDFKGGNVFKTSLTQVKLRTGFEDLTNSGVEVYASQKVLYVNLSYRATIAVFDLSGRLVYSSSLDSGNNSIPLQQTGIYLVKVTGNQETVSRKVFIE